MKTMIAESMIAEFEKAIKGWKACADDDNEMKRVYISDRKDLRKVLSLIKVGKIEEASIKAYWLDTVVRDVIPNDVYNYIMDEKSYINIKESRSDMIMDAFTEEQQSVILELARVALANADTYDRVADEMDLSDCYLKGLQIMIEAVSEGVE